MPKVAIELHGVKAFCSAGQVAEVISQLQENPICVGFSDSDVGAPNRFGLAASGIASFVKETHEYVGACVCACRKKEKECVWVGVLFVRVAPRGGGNNSSWSLYFVN